MMVVVLKMAANIYQVVEEAHGHLTGMKVLQHRQIGFLEILESICVGFVFFKFPFRDFLYQSSRLLVEPRWLLFIEANRWGTKSIIKRYLEECSGLNKVTQNTYTEVK